MYSIYAISQGERDVEAYRVIPWPAKTDVMFRIGYYMWCLKGEKDVILVDTGMNDEDAGTRKLNGTDYLKSRLAKLGVDAATVETVIITHLHFDHISAYKLYTKATFYIQKKEFDFFTGPAMQFRQVADLAPDMAALKGLVKAKRMKLINGDKQVARGVKAVLVGGHTLGSQVVVVDTVKGKAVICGDAVDTYRNLDERIVAVGAEHLPGLLALDRIKALASAPELIVPGHEPLVLKKFPAVVENVAQIA